MLCVWRTPDYDWVSGCEFSQTCECGKCPASISFVMNFGIGYIRLSRRYTTHTHTMDWMHWPHGLHIVHRSREHDCRSTIMGERVCSSQFLFFSALSATLVDTLVLAAHTLITVAAKGDCNQRRSGNRIICRRKECDVGVFVSASGKEANTNTHAHMLSQFVIHHTRCENWLVRPIASACASK